MMALHPLHSIIYLNQIQQILIHHRVFHHYQNQLIVGCHLCVKSQSRIHHQSYPPPQLKTQATTSSTITDPSFEDTTSEHPCDTASEFYSQSFETNIYSSNPGIDDEQQGLTYDERQRRISLTAKPVISLVQSNSSHPLRITSQHYSDSLASPEANIDVSMVSSKSNYFSMKKKKNNISCHLYIYI